MTEPRVTIADNLNILIVDDQERITTSLLSILSNEGYAVRAVNCGKQALDLLARESFDILLLDLKMPEITGFDVLKQLSGTKLDTQIIVISGETSFEAVIEALRHRVYDYLPKPYSPERLLHVIGKAAQDLQLRRDNCAMETRLANSERLHRFMVDSSPDIIYILDRKGCFKFVNSKITRLLGYEASELIGQHYSAIVHPADAKVAEFVFNERRTGDRASRDVEIRLRCKGDSSRPKYFETSTIAIELNSMGIYMTQEEKESSGSLFNGTYGVARDISDRIRANKLIRHQAHHDPLTDLPNRVLFNDHLQLALSQAQRNSDQLSVIFIDLDHFKIFNDTLGHGVGDELLKLVATRFAECVRGGDTLARLGGDEFVLLLPIVKGPEEAAAVAQKILAALKEPLLIAGKEYLVGASLGISIYPQDGADTSDLVRTADVAMYHAKESGKGSFSFYSAEMDKKLAGRLSMESDLRRAIDREQFVVHYQPQFDLKSGRIVGVEALIRWQHPEKGIIAPYDFIGLAEETGLIVPIGRWLMEKVCSTFRGWRELGIDHVRMAVNVSALELEREDYIREMISTLGRYSIPCVNFEVEITENVLVKDTDLAVRKLQTLAAHGVSVAIDDFGTGYSSLGMLHKLPINVLKIDRCFIDEIGEKAPAQSIVQAIVAMAKGMGMGIIAEGVETVHQHDYLLSTGCSSVQGFLYSHPLDEANITRLLAGDRAILAQAEVSGS